jgi:hypothetical protein
VGSGYGGRSERGPWVEAGSPIGCWRRNLSVLSEPNRSLTTLACELADTIQMCHNPMSRSREGIIARKRLQLCNSSTGLRTIFAFQKKIEQSLAPSSELSTLLTHLEELAWASSSVIDDLSAGRLRSADHFPVKALNIAE